MTAVKLSDQRGTGGGRVERRCTISTIKDEALGSTGQNAFIAVGFLLPYKMCSFPGRDSILLQCRVTSRLILWIHRLDSAAVKCCAIRLGLAIFELHRPQACCIYQQALGGSHTIPGVFQPP